MGSGELRDADERQRDDGADRSGSQQRQADDLCELPDGFVEPVSALYPDAFGYDGDRGVVVGSEPDEAALRHVIALALTYHSGKKAARSAG